MFNESDGEFEVVEFSKEEVVSVMAGTVPAATLAFMASAAEGSQIMLINGPISVSAYALALSALLPPDLATAVTSLASFAATAYVKSLTD